ncbi:hypothetical protein DFH06DRAFT_1222699 [Mycena polygramma]|nr:hypothetical protein DFH06DRAFT_1222699 [Mycena polygramma]
MPPIFKSLALLILLATVSHADEEADYRLSFDCAVNSTKPGASPLAMFVNPSDKSCRCLPAGTNDPSATKCPSPTAGLRSGLAICVTGVGCKMECAQNAIPAPGDCIPYEMAPGAPITELTDEDCSKLPDADPTDVVGSYVGGSCLCKAPVWHKSDGGTVCNENIPENSVAVCKSSFILGDSICSFRCMPGAHTSEDQQSCVVGPPPQESGNPSTGGNTGNADVLTKACSAPKSVSYSSPNAACGCESSINKANMRVKPATATQCMPPPAHGKAACKNVGSGSQCTVDCEIPYKASGDGKTCIPARQNSTKSEFDCGSNAGAVQYLSADPNGGCMCKDEDDGTCSVSASNSDPDAEMICSDTTDMGGNRDVTCAVKCTDTFVATDKKTCGPREVEGDTVTMAGTASPNGGEVSCTSKVYKLPGKGGCKCDTAKPDGATECTAGQNAYPICAYEKGSGDEADCGIACVPGKNLFGNKCR